ncbi:hypothetical protein KAFR_0A03190 [Kazachstania africana CBS 2517]|uniref:Major facilitator superfamily (MFS) profile domain-containing protein n=1 Tax=Kazachstania africana (strain ATCC 22294 / BCRC 22015 / CBS 2517 / CECT 1963 / NBRC 1671 / NRRL Y-8276) TaxID=1071382 RepID=H2AN04_KAZAF|nr:hypothetical protein KAFR_0A03190 [Kazachstania africana CBS 2517]CCF55754.1 hypothetical protein KAFR_0A03190 [Kazachstania africana CBS 2517]
MNILKELKEAPKDIKLLWASVFLRLMSYGLTNQVLTLFLNAIDMKEDKIGLFMSLTLFGDVICSYILTWYADSWGRRRVLVYGSVMMCLSGIVFSYSQNFHVLLIFAIFGVISPSSDEVGPFKSIEESMIAHLSPNNKRPEVYAMHALVGTMGSALGAIICGFFVDTLKHYGIAKTNLECYKLVFLFYALLALGKVIIMFSLSEKTELDGHYHEVHHNATGSMVEAIGEETDELAPLITQREEIDTDNTTSSGRLSKETRTVLMKLLIIFMIDSFGSGFMTSGWMVYYYKKVFGVRSISLGTMFFCVQIVQAFSTIPSSIVARLFGPVRATLLVQVPSGIFSILIPLAESHLSLSIFLLNLHFATTAMDVTPRQILLTNLITPRDLTKVMGIVNIGKTFARCIGPIFTGVLARRSYLWLCYIISGSLVILADSILACLFLDVDKRILKQINQS